MYEGTSCSGKYYPGTITYSYDSATTYSYRRIVFDAPTSSTTFYPVSETYVYAASENDLSHLEFLRLKECDKCYFKSLGSTYKSEQLFKGGINTDSYIKTITFNSDNKTIKSFKTPYNCFELNSYTEKSSFDISDNYYFGGCVSKNCHVEMDFIFSYDFSGSMNGNRFTKSITLAQNILSAFTTSTTSDSDIKGAIIRWERKATIQGSNTVSSINSSGFTNYSTLNSNLSDFGKTTPSGGTCLICGYRAMYEVGYLQYRYEYKHQPSDSSQPSRYKNAGRVGFILTDGAATYSTPSYLSISEPIVCSKQDATEGCPLYNGDCPTYKKSKCQKSDYAYSCEYVNNSCKTIKYYKGWYKESGTGSDYASSYKTDVETAKSNAETHYSTKATQTGEPSLSFFEHFTVIAIAAYDAADSTQNSAYRDIFAAISYRDSRLSSSFPVTYFFKDLENLDSFYNSLKTNICGAFDGDQDNKCSDSSSKPCCNGNTPYCPYIDSNKNICKSITPTYSNGKCVYDSTCNNDDANCIVATCNNGACNKKYPDVDPCYNYKCDGKGNLKQTTSTDCYVKRSSFKLTIDPCKQYKCNSNSQKTDWNKGNYKLQAADWDNYCKIDSSAEALCGLDSCIVTEPKPDYTTETACKNAHYTWDKSIISTGKCYYIYDFNRVDKCNVYTCVVDNNADNKSITDISPKKCNYCEYCDTDDSKCKDIPKTEDPCLDSLENPQYDPNVMIEGCWDLPHCDKSLNNNNGGCSEPVDLCAQQTTNCVKYYCDKKYEGEGDNAQFISAQCNKVDVECVLPASLPSRCYSSTCVDSKGGCYVSINFDNINDCGDCAELSTCDESALVITAAIGAGVVAAIVVVAVVALSVGLLASKKMYDMISGANEARMDAAQENQLYQSENKGGDNPLFA